MLQRAEKGYWNGGIVPYGYRAEDKRLVPHEEEAQRLRFMFQHFARHASLSGLRDELNRRGWPTRTGRPWGKAALQYVLRNRLYLGEIQLKGKFYPGIHEALIDADVFDKAGRLTPARTHPTTTIPRAFPLKGLLRCADCGSTMTPHYVQKRRADGSVNRIPYYRCTKTMQFNNQVCRIKHVNALEVEGTIVRELAALSRNDAYVRMTVEEANRERGRRAEPLQQDESRLEKRLAEIEAEIQRFVTALGKGRLSAEHLESAIEERDAIRRRLQSELDDVRQRLATEASASVNADLLLKALGDFDAIFASLTPQEQKDALQCILQGVTVTADRLVIEVFELPEFSPAGSQNRSNWLPGLYDLRTIRFEVGRPGHA